ncbi:LOW QUALITY PROTEIN: UV radiation resistance-associated gene protein [Coccidioides immitis RMSCC 2394]|uniref:Autophagy-related protein 14 n=1 Tax=Coccidioides immitis RMSCC 2394 TaxID=404692 RepID=A0A0J7BFP7_COCIT|nr:LOW QUALITY PROTEIN: UV radiation resistance-associated gene protein [Coccidioides immitis RMSCC 2394]
MSVAEDQSYSQHGLPAGKKDRPWLLPSNRKLRNLQGISVRNLLVTPPPATRSRGKTIDDDSVPNTLQTPAKILASKEARTVHHSRSVTDLNRVASCRDVGDTRAARGEDGKQHRTQALRIDDEAHFHGRAPTLGQARLEDITARRMADTWFSLHCPDIEQPVYVSEVIERAMNPTFKSFDLSSSGPLVSRADNAVVNLWAKPADSAEYFLLLEFKVQFRALQYIGKTLESFRHPLPLNCVIFHFVDGLYTVLTDIAPSEPSTLPRSLGKTRSEGGSSPIASYDTLMRLVNLDDCLQDALATRDKLEVQISSVLEENKAYLDILNQKAQAEERLASIKKSVALEKKRLQQSLKQKESLIASINARKAAMQQGRESQEKTLSYLQEAEATKTSSEKLLQKTRDESIGQIRRICEDLSSIYPIEPIPGKALAFTILGIPLPNSNFENIDKESVAAALGFTAHLVYLLSFYLSVPLPYPIQPYSSNSFIQDPISVGITQRTFPLYPVNAHYRFEYGVFLLNKDIECLLSRQGLRVLDIRQTLPNLKYLLYLLTSATSELPARKAGGVRGLLAGRALTPDPSRRQSTESVASGDSSLNQKRVWQGGGGGPAILINGGGMPKARHGDDEDQRSVTTMTKATASGIGG